MTSLASKARYRQHVIQYARRYGVTQAGIRYRVSRQAIYKWIKRYDGDWKSLIDRSHRPHHHPKEHTEEEIELIKRYYRYNKDDRIILWDKLRKNGYKRSYGTMLRVIRRLNLEPPAKKPKESKVKPYKRAEYPGQKIQIDVKYVPTYSVANGNKYYQYTAIDECTRVVHREMYEEHSTYNSKDFLMKMLAFYTFPVREVQTDNGSEFTNMLLCVKRQERTLFETALADMGILYHRIRIATPRHNGKVERQHRLDEERFYSKMRMYCLEDGQKQLTAYNKRSNDIPKVCLKFRTPNEVLSDYLAII